MKLICPKCGSSFEMEQAVRELEQAETHDIAAKLGQHWRLVWEYSECSRQEEYGDVSLTKRLRIFKSIAKLFDTMMFEYRRKRYRTSWHEVIKAMTTICNLQKREFTNNNYLYKMLIGTADRLSAEGLSATEEQKREEKRSLGRKAHLRRGFGGQVIGSEKDQEPGMLDFKRVTKEIEACPPYKTLAGGD
jgi:hypothetical protein